MPAHLHRGADLRRVSGRYWYTNVTPENAERIIQEHLIGGRIVRDLCFAENPLD